MNVAILYGQVAVDAGQAEQDSWRKLRQSVVQTR
jgi:hypothetical protein